MFANYEDELKRERAKMVELRKNALLPAGLLDLVERTMEAQARATAGIESAAGFAAGVALEPWERVASGAPLLARRSFGYDVSGAKALFGELLDVLEGAGGPMARAAGKVRAGGEGLMRQSFDAFLQDEGTVFVAFAEVTPEAPRALSYLAQSSLAPWITAAAREIAGRLPEGRTWGAVCPVCGSLPLISTLTGKEGGRVHTCSFCRASYRTPRLQCPYCQEQDAAKLPYFTADEAPGFRVDACLTCQGYVKTVDFREFDRASVPVLDDLESMVLDMMAAKRGFKRHVLCAWGF